MSRRTWNAAWLFFVLVVVGLVATRYARSFGLLGVIAPVVVVIVILAVLRSVGPVLVIPSRRPAPPAGPRNVTPDESSRSTVSTVAPRPTAAPVVVIEPAVAPGETLEAKLATLDVLHRNGRLTDTEYEVKRAQLLADF